jgi:hypothetical protein
VDWQLVSDDTTVELEASTPDDRVAEIFSWRLEQLERAGYSHTHAVSLAENLLIDLHRACELVVRGCPERTAYLILA